MSDYIIKKPTSWKTFKERNKLSIEEAIIFGKKCQTCNNKGLVPDMTAAVDGERIGQFEICPDCQGRQEEIKCPIIEHKQLVNTDCSDEEDILTENQFVSLYRLIPASFGTMRLNLTRLSREKAGWFIDALVSIKAGLTKSYFTKSIYKKLYVHLYDDTSVIL